MRLNTSQLAAPFSAETVEGQTISLAQFAGKPLLLMFMRYASCPMCNLRLHDFARQYAPLHQRGLEVVVFFHSSAVSIRAHAGGRHYPFPLVADPDLRVYRAYGVETSWLRFLLSMAKPSFYVDWVRSLRYRFWGGVARQMAKMPADFLIGPDGRIASAHYGSDIGDHIPLSEIDAFLRDFEPPAATDSAVSRRDYSIARAEAPVISSRSPIVLSLLWAFALIASSYFLKGLAVGDWVDAGLYMIAAGLVGTWMFGRRRMQCA